MDLEKILNLDGEAAGETPADEIPSTKEQLSLAQQLVEIVLGRSSLFHSPKPDFIAYADIQVDGHQETLAVRSRDFILWLTQLSYEKLNTSPSDQTLKTVIRDLESFARFKSSEKQVHLRIAGVGDKIYLDLANSSRDQVEIDEDGYRIISSSESQVKFKNPPGMEALPTPVKGGSLLTLRDILNIHEDDEIILIISWLVSTMMPKGPYPILLLQGQQGTAKTTTAKVLRSIIDPGKPLLNSLPRNGRDLMIAAISSWIQSFDNISGLPVWLSDALCRIATGIGFRTRKLRTDESEVLFETANPIILNGITDIATRFDLADRSLIVPLSPIPEEKRKTEKQIWQSLEKERPAILGALCDAVSAALRNVDKVTLEQKPRMADSAQWVTAAEDALPWKNGSFMEAYMKNQSSLVDIALESDPVSSSIFRLMDGKSDWSGTPSELLEALNVITDPSIRRFKVWPKQPNILSNRLRQMGDSLKKKGIIFDRGHSGNRNINLFKSEERSNRIIDDNPLELIEVNGSEIENDFDDQAGYPREVKIVEYGTKKSRERGSL